MSGIPLDGYAPAIAQLLRVMANENRLLILSALLPGEQNVNELARNLGLRQAALSQHLARLRHAGLVRGSRRSRLIFYSVQQPLLGQVIEMLMAVTKRTGSPLLQSMLEAAPAPQTPEENSDVH